MEPMKVSGSGKCTGRPLGAAGVRTLAARAARRAVEALAFVAGDANAAAADRVKAAEALLRHAAQSPNQGGTSGN